MKMTMGLIGLIAQGGLRAVWEFYMVRAFEGLAKIKNAKEARA